MTYLLLGDDAEKKETKIADLKKKLQFFKEAEKFDYEVLHGNKLNPQTLKKALLALPAVLDKRLILIRDCHKLSPHNKKLLIEFISFPASDATPSAKGGVVSDAVLARGSMPRASGPAQGRGPLTKGTRGAKQKSVSAKDEHALLILESSELSARDSFVKKLQPFAEIFDFSSLHHSQNVFDMTRAIVYRRQPEALTILSRLLSDGVHPLQIMGGLVWFWGKRRQQLAFEKFEEGLMALGQADLNIKRSRLRPDYTLELLVVKLCGILG